MPFRQHISESLCYGFFNEPVGFLCLYILPTNLGNTGAGETGCDIAQFISFISALTTLKMLNHLSEKIHYT